MTHDPLCPSGVKPWEDTYCCQRCTPGDTPPWERTCRCDLAAKVTHDPACRCKCHITDFGPCDDCSAAISRGTVPTDAAVGRQILGS